MRGRILGAVVLVAGVGCAKDREQGPPHSDESGTHGGSMGGGGSVCERFCPRISECPEATGFEPCGPDCGLDCNPDCEQACREDCEAERAAAYELGCRSELDAFYRCGATILDPCSDEHSVNVVNVVIGICNPELGPYYACYFDEQ